MAVCKECATPIVWAQTRNRRSMALNRDPKDVTPNIAAQRVVRLLVQARVITDDQPLQLHEEAFVAHWVTCPAADRFRRNHQPDQPKPTQPAVEALF